MEIRGNKGLFAYFLKFKSFIIDENTGIIKTVINIHKKSIQRICLPLTLLLCTFYNNHCIDLVGHTGLEKTKRNIMDKYYFPNLTIWIKILIADCIQCQTNKVFANTKTTSKQEQLAPTKTYFNEMIMIDTKEHIHPTSEGNNYIYVIVDAFSHYVTISDHSGNSTIQTPTQSELRANPFLPPTFQQRQDFNFVQEHFRAQPLHSPNSSLWSAASPQSASSNTTPQRSNQTSSSITSVSVPHVELTNSLQPPRNTALSPSSFILETRFPSSHPGRARSKPILNPNPTTKSRTNEHTYLFALDHKTWIPPPPPPLYGPTNLGDTVTNWSRSRPTNTLILTHRQRKAEFSVLATPSLELKFNTTIKYDTVFNHPFHTSSTVHLH